MTAERVEKVCATCKSTRVMRDAWAVWNSDTQQWELGNVFDAAHCDVCDCDTTIEDKPIELELMRDLIRSQIASIEYGGNTGTSETAQKALARLTAELAEINGRIADYDPTCAMCENGSEPGHEH